ncbi:MAG: cytochrome d ubiquinol oxidase subunit II [Pseudomonadota bacterium]
METSSLAGVWYAIIVLAFLFYVLVDGFDLGSGILSLFIRDDEFVGASVAGIHGVWHANQTWLVVVGASLFGAFPLAYGVIFSALYLPVGLMLFGLVIRWLALEYYYSSANRVLVGRAYGVGSLIMALAQGAGVGAILAGLPEAEGKFAGDVWTWLNPFALLLAAGLPVFYSLLGATWLVCKTEGKVQESGRRAARRTGVLSLAGAAVVAGYGLAAHPFWARDWFAQPGFTTTLLPLLIGFLAFIPFFLSLAKGGERGPFVFSLAAVSFLFLGIASGVYPYIVPPAVTVSAAAADPAVLRFMLTGMLVVFPLIVIYTFYMYRVFGGKVRELGSES